MSAAGLIDKVAATVFIVGLMTALCWATVAMWFGIGWTGALWRRVRHHLGGGVPMRAQVSARNAAVIALVCLVGGGVIGWAAGVDLGTKRGRGEREAMASISVKGPRSFVDIAMSGCAFEQMAGALHQVPDAVRGVGCDRAPDTDDVQYRGEIHVGDITTTGADSPVYDVRIERHGADPSDALTADTAGRLTIDDDAMQRRFDVLDARVKLLLEQQARAERRDRGMTTDFRLVELDMETGKPVADVQRKRGHL